jgi:hypothetical protein
MPSNPISSGRCIRGLGGLIELAPDNKFGGSGDLIFDASCHGRHASGQLGLLQPTDLPRPDGLPANDFQHSPISIWIPIPDVCTVSPTHILRLAALYGVIRSPRRSRTPPTIRSSGYQAPLLLAWMPQQSWEGLCSLR